MFKRANLAKGELSAQLLIAGVSLVLEASQGTAFPATGSGNIFTGIIWGSTFATPFDDTAREIVTAYRSSGDTFTIVRAQEGTTAKQWEVGDNFMLTMTSAAFGDLVSETTTSASTKSTPVDADLIPLVDSAASNVIKSLSWADLKAAMLSYFTTVTTTWTNKRINPRNDTTASSATPSINTDTTDDFTITALAAAITSMTTNLTGTPVNGQKLVIRIKDNGTARAITWGASFANRGATLPTTTVINKTVYVGLKWNSTTSTWDCIAVSQEV